jgi:serine/threonine protein kinase/predicted Zn-dependent protease
MALTSADLTRMSLLLDEALPLDGSGRQAWLEALPAEHQDLLLPLRTALLTAGGEIRRQDSLTDLPDLGPSIDAVLAAQGSDMNAGSVVGPYRLIRELGRGGMGSVWLAERIDGTLKRQVALKLPHSTLPQRQLAERFARERDILAGLVHANIARLYDAGVTVEGQPWLALEYVEGETLITWCDSRKLDIKARIELFRQVLAAVHYAHRQQVVHRDLKPNNILVNRDGDVRLLDFGIAKLMTEGELQETALTKIGGRALSIQYASPEQILGQPVTVTSDVYSLGVVLFELLTGSFPYFMQRGSRDAIEDNILSVVPARASQTSANPELAANRGTVPAKLSQVLKGDLDAVLQKTLKKNPAERYDSAKSLADDLDRYLHGKPVLARAESRWYRAVNVFRRHRVASAAITVLVAVLMVGVVLLQETKQSTGSTQTKTLPPSAPVVAAQTVSDKSIAVLPFVDMSEKHDQEYFSDGLSEELIDQLTRYTGLKVIARTSSFYFKGKNEDMRTIASKLGVAYLLEGSVRKSGKTLRITAQLIRASDGAHLWSQTYDRNLSDIFKVQDDVSEQVVQALKVALNSGGSMQETKKPNSEAYNLVLLGNYFKAHQSKQSIEKAIDAYQRALQIDTSYAFAWARLGSAYFNQVTHGWVSPTVGMTKARKALDRALRIDQNLIWAHYTLSGIYMTVDRDWVAAQAEIDRIRIIASQDNFLFLSASGDIASIFGNLDEAIRLYRQVLNLNPLDTYSLATLAGLLFESGRFEEATATSRTLLDMSPRYVNAHATLGIALIFLDQKEQGLASIEEESDENARLSSLPIAYWSMGRKAESDAALKQLVDKYAEVDAYGIAEVYAYRGQVDAAFAWLDRAYQQRDCGCTYVKSDLFLKNLRPDPRYKAFLRKMKLPK